MKKRINKWSVAIWIVAFAYAVIGVVSMWTDHIPNGIGQASYLWVLFRSNAFLLTQLAAIGALIELVDQIRWKMLSPEERSAAQSKPSLWSKLRRWPHKESAWASGWNRAKR